MFARALNAGPIAASGVDDWLSSHGAIPGCTNLAKPFKQGKHAWIAFDQPFRMPLDTDDPIGINPFDRLKNPIRCICGRAKPRA